MGNDYRRSTSAPSPSVTPPNPSWGTITVLRSEAVRALLQLLTPHGERLRESHPLRIRDRPAPNPSWGTITPALRRFRPAVEALLTPHGERLPALSRCAGCRSGPPNPSWGTITPSPRSTPRSPPATPNPSWGTITLIRQFRFLAHFALLTPHGERLRARRGSATAARPPPNPSWGTITLRGQGLAEHRDGLLTPHGERLPPSTRCVSSDNVVS